MSRQPKRKPSSTYLHPDDITIGKRVHWKRGGRVLTGYVIRVLDDKWRPARVRSNGHSYKPHIEDYCAEDTPDAVKRKPVRHNPRVRKALIETFVEAKSTPVFASDVQMCDKLAAYNVRDGGIYLREFNVRLATFMPNSHHLQMGLRAMFDEAAKLRTRGWHTCQCGQWVHDDLCPCTVCSKPRLRAKIVKRRKS